MSQRNSHSLYCFSCICAAHIQYRMDAGSYVEAKDSMSLLRFQFISVLFCLSPTLSEDSFVIKTIWKWFGIVSIFLSLFFLRVFLVRRLFVELAFISMYIFTYVHNWTNPSHLPFSIWLVMGYVERDKHLENIWSSNYKWKGKAVRVPFPEHRILCMYLCVLHGGMH